MNSLSKTVYTHNIIFKEKSEKPISITHKQSEVAKNAMAEGYSTFIELIDEDGSEIYSGIVGTIEQIKPVKKVDKIVYGYCNHGCRHNIVNGSIDCQCQLKYGFHFHMYDWLKEKGYKWANVENIKEEWREEYLKEK